MKTPSLPLIHRHPKGITTVDSHFVRPGFAAVHVLERNGCAVIIDCGANQSVPHILQALELLHLEPEAVDFLFLTHVHLDHAGGAGLLMQGLPNAQAVVHPRGKRHLVDPSALARATREVYGTQAFDRLYGELVPIAEHRIVSSADNQQLTLQGSPLRILHTPGHALHHHCLYDAASCGVFTGDTFGLSYRSTDTAKGPFIVPTTTPTQFDPSQLKASVERIAALLPKAVYLTHFGQVTGVPRLAKSLLWQIDEFEAIARSRAECAFPEESIHSDLLALWQKLLGEHGLVLSSPELEERLGSDLRLNAQGLVAWLARLKKR